MWYYVFAYQEMFRQWSGSGTWLTAQHACNFIEIERPRAKWFGVFTSAGELVGGSILDWETAHTAMCLGYVTGGGTATRIGRTPGFSGLGRAC